MKPRTTWWAGYPEQGAASSGIDAMIPTVGNPTAANDMYRTVGYTVTGHEGWNSCFTDCNTCIGLAKLIEGEIYSWDEIRAAETALQLLMWHDRVDILVPGFKQVEGKFKSYVRCDEHRSQLCFDLFKPLHAYDQIYAIEKVTTDSGLIVSSTYGKSSIVGGSIEEAKNNYLNKTQLQASVLSSMPLDFGVPAYLTNSFLEYNFDNAGYFYNLYRSLNSDWNNSEFIPPTIESSMRLPPLLSIVLSRASSRNAIPDAINEIREETSPVRQEILGFNAMLSGAYNQVELENECKRITQSFESIFSASRYEDPCFIFPLLKLYKSFTKPIDELIKIFNLNAKPEDPRILSNRTLTGKVFSHLLVTDSMHSLLSAFFSRAEIRALEADARKNPNKAN